MLFWAQNGIILAYATSLRSKKYFSKMVEIQHGYRPILVIHMSWTTFHYGSKSSEGRKAKIAKKWKASLFPTTSFPWIIKWKSSISWSLWEGGVMVLGRFSKSLFLSHWFLSSILVDILGRCFGLIFRNLCSSWWSKLVFSVVVLNVSF